MILAKSEHIGRSLRVKTQDGRIGILCGMDASRLYVSFSPDESPSRFNRGDLEWVDDPDDQARS